MGFVTALTVNNKVERVMYKLKIGFAVPIEKWECFLCKFLKVYFNSDEPELDSYRSSPEGWKYAIFTTDNYTDIGMCLDMLPEGSHTFKHVELVNGRMVFYD